MISLKSENRDLESLSNLFYKRIKDKIELKIEDNKAVLNTFVTDKTNKPFGDFLEKEIKDLITLPLDDLIIKFKDELHDLCENNYQTINKKHSPFKKALNSVLFYEAQYYWKAYQTAKEIDVSACVYCNRAYITTVGDDSKKFVRGDFDHFMAKSKYPYLRFSFFNLIPCCVICNRNAKGKKSTSLQDNIYPYKEGFENNTVFTFLPNNYEDIIGKGKPVVDFLFLGTNEHNKKAKKNIKLFRLKEQYSIHSQELNDIINKRRIFSDSYLHDLKKSYPELIQNFEEAYLLAFGKEFDLVKDENRPLSKLIRDITDELEIIKNKYD
jgi:hypothetical protein